MAPPLILALVLAQQLVYPPERPPLIPQLPVPTPAGLMFFRAPAHDFAPATDGRPVRVIYVFPSNTIADQAAASAQCAAIEPWNNTIYTNSKTTAMQVAACLFTTAYTSSGNMDTDLAWLQSSPQAQAWRDQYQAPMIQMASTDTRYCGLGYMNCQTYGKSFCSSIVQWSCAQYHMSSVHEMGHNEGVEHDDANASRDAAYPDGYGWHNLTNNNADPMSYVGDRQMSFSELDLTVNGVVFGDANHQTARTLRLTMPIIAGFYPPVSTHRPSTLTSLTAAQE